MSEIPNHKQASKDKRIGFIFAGVAVFMLGVSFAAVPLYRLMCQITGIDGTPKRSDKAPDSILAHKIKIRFDSNVAGGLPWKFTPNENVSVQIGEVKNIEYAAQNLAVRETTGSATFNVLPESAAKYFNKMQCFCFNEQTLKSGEKINMPVVFYVDPDILKDIDTKNIDTITLSYTFFPVKTVQRVSINTLTK
jgi:cytochrome c oxidase assembly protein subunit 11